MSKEQEDTIRELNHSRKGILSAIEDLDEVQSSSIVVVGEWTVKELLIISTISKMEQVLPDMKLNTPKRSLNGAIG